MKSKKSKNFKKHIQELYLARLQSHALFNQQGQLSGKVKIVIKKRNVNHSGSCKTDSRFLIAQKRVPDSQEPKIVKKSHFSDLSESSLFNIKKMTKAKKGSSFKIVARPRMAF